MGASLSAASLYAIAAAAAAFLFRGGRSPQLVAWCERAGALALRALLLLVPPAAKSAFSLLDCVTVSLSAVAAASLDGAGSGSASASSSASAAGTGRPARASGAVSASVLASNSYYLCWAPGGSHAAAGAVAVATIVVVVVCVPLATLVALWTERQMRVECCGRSSDARCMRGIAVRVQTSLPCC